MLSSSHVGRFFNGEINRFVHDNFQSVQSIATSLVGTGFFSSKLHEATLQTGVLQNSSCLAYYNNPMFNPHYSKAYWRITIPDIANIEAFIGFKASTSAPTFTMTESHSGIFIKNSKVYATSGNNAVVGGGYRNVEILGLDLTRDNIFELIKTRISSCPLPQIVPYFDTFRIRSFGRKWGFRGESDTYPPFDTLHYFVFYIKNTGNLARTLIVKNFTYLEDYAD